MASFGCKFPRGRVDQPNIDPITSGLEWALLVLAGSQNPTAYNFQAAHKQTFELNSILSFRLSRKDYCLADMESQHSDWPNYFWMVSAKTLAYRTLVLPSGISRFTPN